MKVVPLKVYRSLAPGAQAAIRAMAADLAKGRTVAVMERAERLFYKAKTTAGKVALDAVMNAASRKMLAQKRAAVKPSRRYARRR